LLVLELFPFGGFSAHFDLTSLNCIHELEIPSRITIPPVGSSSMSRKFSAEWPILQFLLRTATAAYWKVSVDSSWLYSGLLRTATSAVISAWVVTVYSIIIKWKILQMVNILGYRQSIFCLKFKFENVMKMKNKPDPAPLRTLLIYI
jgi:hypothetical protein